MDLDVEDIISYGISPIDNGDGDRKGDCEMAVEEDENEDREPVTLGFVEKPKNPTSLLRHFFPSKAGGVPAWLDPLSLPGEKSRSCGFCENPLQFLLQIYAPISENESAFHRILYVFMCPSMACLLKDQHEQWKRRTNGSSPRSVKVFRYQLPRDNVFYSRDPPKYDGSDKPSGPGALLCCWCGTWKGEKVCSSCKTARYCSEKHQVAHWRSGHKSDCQRIILSSKDTANSTNTNLQMKNTGMKSSFQSVVCNTLWPEYEIVHEDECLSDDNVGDEVPKDSGSFASSMVSGKPYAEDDEEFNALENKFEADDDKKSWATFQVCIGKDPEQVLRYCRDVKGGAPLWPVSAGKPSKQDIPKCCHCSSPMSYEFQILPQLLYYFGLKNEVDSVDWATVVVYTCSASCKLDSTGYAHEFPWVQIQP